MLEPCGMPWPPREPGGSSVSPPRVSPAVRARCEARGDEACYTHVSHAMIARGRLSSSPSKTLPALDPPSAASSSSLTAEPDRQHQSHINILLKAALFAK